MKLNSYFLGSLTVAGILFAAFLARDIHNKDVTEKNAITSDTVVGNHTNADEAASIPEQSLIQQAKTQKPAQKKSMNQYVLPELQERLDVMQKRRPDAEFDATAVEAAMNRETLWSAPKQIPKDLPLKPEEFSDGRQFIAFDSLKMETLVPGDSMKIAIDEHRQNYEVVIDRIEQTDYETITWHGHLDGGNGQTYPTSFTRGKDLTVGGIDTPEGNYVIQSHGDKGWVASSGLLFKADPDGTDMVIPKDHLLEEGSL
jgi:hypothetical protein